MVLITILLVLKAKPGKGGKIQPMSAARDSSTLCENEGQNSRTEELEIVSLGVGTSCFNHFEFHWVLFSQDKL